MNLTLKVDSLVQTNFQYLFKTLEYYSR